MKITVDTRRQRRFTANFAWRRVRRKSRKKQKPLGKGASIMSGKTNVLLCAVCAIALSLSPLAVSSARATPVTFYFSGTITAVSDANHLLDNSVAVGTPFDGHYTFESTAGDINGAPSLAQYYSKGAAYEYVVHVGNYTIMRSGTATDDFGGIEIDVGNNNGGSDSYIVNSQGAVTVSPSLDPSAAFFRSVLLLFNTDQTAFNSTNLPLTPPSLTPFTSPKGFNSFTADGYPAAGGSPLVHIEGTLTSLVPEPQSLALLGIGMAGLLRKRRRNRQ